MIVLSEGRVLSALREDARLSLLRGTAHEVAHFWWSFGARGADWINEAFAEYFALVAVERIDDVSAYDRAIAGYRTAVNRLRADAPSLAAVADSNSGDGYVIRYQKGSLLLHALRGALGDEVFFEACRGFFEAFRGDGATTEDFRTFWNARLGKKAGMVNQWIDSPGGVPK